VVSAKIHEARKSKNGSAGMHVASVVWWSGGTLQKS